MGYFQEYYIKSLQSFLMFQIHPGSDLETSKGKTKNKTKNKQTSKQTKILCLTLTSYEILSKRYFALILLDG